MTRRFRPALPPEPTYEQDDPWRFGWRYVRRKRADGTRPIAQVPLTWEDLLYPEEGDFVSNGPVHLTDRLYLHSTIEGRFCEDPSVVVLYACRIDWGVPELRAGGPDIVVLFGVREWRRKGTFRVAEEGGTPVLVIEITSPITRALDLGPKLQLYHRAGVQRYVVVDRGHDWTGTPRLHAFERGPEGWTKQKRDAKHRLNLAPIPLAIGVKKGRAWLYDPNTGDRFLSYEETITFIIKVRKATARAEAETKKHEAQIRRAEKRIRELEEQLRRQQGKP